MGANLQVTSTLDIISAIGTIITPLLVLLLTGIGWSIRNRSEKTRQLEEKLRDDRIQIYTEILEPFIIMFTKQNLGAGSEKTNAQVASDLIKSFKYKQLAFKLSLVGTDEVLRAYSDLMQHMYGQANNNEGTNAEQVLSLFGRLLLEIRRSFGNEKTKLNNFEILEFMITDIRKFQENGKYPGI